MGRISRSPQSHRPGRAEEVVGLKRRHDLKRRDPAMATSTIAHVNVSTARTPAGRDHRARIEALLDKANSEVLAHLWEEVFPYPVDELPQRPAMIEDLADFAEVLQPRFADMPAEQLCRLIEKYAATRRRQQSFVRSLTCGAGERRAADVMSRRPVSRRLERSPYGRHSAAQGKACQTAGGLALLRE